MKILILLPTNKGYLKVHTSYLAKTFANTTLYEYNEKYKMTTTSLLCEDISKFIKSNKIDTVIFFSQFSFIFNIDFFLELKKQCLLIMWTFDDEVLFDISSKYYAQVFDKVITTDYFSNQKYREIGVSSFLYFSSYKQSRYKNIELEQDIDVSFVGWVDKKDRIDYINQILTFNNVKSDFFGKGSKNGFIDSEKMIEVFNRSKINLNFTKCLDHDWLVRLDPFINLKRQNKGRPIEVALTNSFCLSEYSPSLEFMFDIGAGKEIDVFHNSDELHEKIEFYLKNEKIRIQMANNAYIRAVREYKEENYLNKVMSFIKEEISQDRTCKYVVYNNGTVNTHHIIHSILLLLSKKFILAYNEIWQTDKAYIDWKLIFKLIYKKIKKLVKKNIL